MAKSFNILPDEPISLVNIIGMAFTFVLASVSIIMLSFGIWLSVKDYGSILSPIMPEVSYWSWLAYGFIVIGLFTLSTGVTGFIGFLREQIVTLCSFMILLVICFLGFAVLTALPLWYSTEVRNNLYGNMKQSLPLYSGETAVDSDSELWNFVQTKWACCGVDGDEDYQYIKWVYQNISNQFTLPVRGTISRYFPAACCEYYYIHQPSLDRIRSGTWIVDKYAVVDCYEKNPDPNPPHTMVEGCYKKLRDYISANMDVIGWISLSIVCSTVILFAITFYVIIQKKRDEEPGNL